MVDGWYAERESRNVGTGPAGGRTSDLYYYSDTGTRFRSRCLAKPKPNPDPNPNPNLGREVAVQHAHRVDVAQPARHLVRARVS